MKPFIDPGIYGETKLVILNPHDVKSAPYNPGNRTDPRACAKLKREIKTAGRVLNPIHVTSDLMACDGHRRTLISKELGLSGIPALVYSFSSSDPRAAQLYNTLNISPRAYKPADQLIAYLQGGEPASKGIQEKGDFLRSLLSSSELETFIDRSGSPYLLKIGKDVATYCYPGQRLSVPIVRKFLRTAIMWLIECNMQQPVRRYMEEYKASAKKLIDFVNSGMPVVFPPLRRRPV